LSQVFSSVQRNKELTMQLDFGEVEL
jgi:hypothetical protein